MRYSVFKELFVTACAGAMMNEFEVGRKVRCHRGGLWKTVEDQEATRLAWRQVAKVKIPRGFGVVESHPFAKNAKGWSTRHSCPSAVRSE